MGRIGEDDVRRVRESTDVVSLVSERVVLKQKGRLFWGCCPFHNEKTPSFKVDPASQLWHCFGCGKGGDVYGFLMEAEHMSFPDAIRYLADRANIEIVEDAGGLPTGRRERLIAVCTETAEYYHQVLTRSPDEGAAHARAYLASRGFGSEVAKRWSLGYAPGRGALVKHLMDKGFSADEIVEANVGLNGDRGGMRDRFYERIMFPIADLQGRTIAFGGRVLGSGEPKYLNTQETPLFHKSANLFAIDRAKSAIVTSGTALVTEGYTDVIALHESGVQNAVATLGTALTGRHVKLLARFAKRVVYVFDGDEAGLRAADRAIGFIDESFAPESGSRSVELLVAMLPAGEDPADHVAAHGRESFDRIVSDAVPLLRFAIDRRLARWDLDQPEQRVRALRDAAEVLVPVRGSILADDYANYIAGRLPADYKTVRRAIDEVRVTAPRADAAAGQQQVTQGAVAEPDSHELKLERELLSLVATSDELRERAESLLDRVPWTSARHKALAGLIHGSAGSSVAELVARAEEADPGSGAILSGGTLDQSSSYDPTQAAELLISSLVESDLERRIAAGNARLRTSGTLTPEEFDALFSEVVELQKKLAQLRTPVRAHDER